VQILVTTQTVRLLSRTLNLSALYIHALSLTLKGDQILQVSEHKMQRKILLHVHPLLGNVLGNKFPRRQTFGKQSVARLRNNRRGCVFYVVRAKQQ
jgi:hypothetical protein